MIRSFPATDRPMNRLILAILLTGVVMCAGRTRAQEAAGQPERAGQPTPPADKSGYTLFNPTPRDLMREMSTDRPDVTESPISVDAGHVQVELSLFAYTHDRQGDDHADTLALLPANVKLGLTNSVDLQLVLDPFLRERAGGTGGGRSDGFGDMQVRVKFNLWGNDGGDTALALMPFVQLPTGDADLGGTDHVQGGLIVPLSLALPHEFGLGLMAEFDVVRDEADDGYGFEFLHSATLNHEIAGDLAGYVEYVGVSPVDTGNGYLAYFSAGLTYALTEDVQLDGGILLGISDEAEDYTAFAGLSFRL